MTHPAKPTLLAPSPEFPKHRRQDHKVNDLPQVLELPILSLNLGGWQLALQYLLFVLYSIYLAD